MATGSGKTKVMSLLIVWSYFSRVYENKNELSSNFLIIAPNIIVLDRLKTDFDNLNIFRKDPCIPDDGINNQNWKIDFFNDVEIHDKNKQELKKTRKYFFNKYSTNLYR
jgi:type III restriction enzyme